MSFEYPHYLFFLFSPVIILILYIIFQRKRKVLVSSLTIWKETHGTVKYESHIMKHTPFLISFLMLILLIFLIAKPFFRETNYKYIIILDNSLTMGVVEDGKETRWEKAKKIARKYSKRDSIIIVTNPRTKIVTQEELKNIGYVSGESPKKTIHFAKNLLAKDEQLIIVTDGAGPYWSEVFQSIKKEIPYAFVHIIGKEKDNMGLRVKYTKLHQRKKLLCRIEVINNSNTLKKNVLCWRVQGNLYEVPIVLDPYQRKEKDFTLTIFESKSFRCWLKKKDAFPLDDALNISTAYFRKAKVLIVSDKPRPYILAALMANAQLLNRDESAVTFRDTFVNDKQYDLVIYCKKKFHKNNIESKFLFFATQLSSSFSLKKKRNIVFWGMNSRHPIAKQVYLSDLKIDRAWQGKNIPYNNIISHSNIGPIIWEGKLGKRQYIYCSFRIEDSMFHYHYSFPIFIHNVLLWAMKYQPFHRVKNSIDISEMNIEPFKGKLKNSSPRRTFQKKYLFWDMILIIALFCSILLGGINYYNCLKIGK